jgi:hypothetical protein
VERSDLIPGLDHLRATRRGDQRRTIDALGKRIATLQGSAARAAASTVTVGTVDVDLDNSPTQWLVVDGKLEGPAELYVQSADCTPNIVAFPAAARLPARPLGGQVRFSAQLNSIPASGPIALRITAGNCEEAVVSLQISRTAPRVALTVEPRGTSTSARPFNHYPSVTTDQLTVISLEQRAAQTFSIQTEPGFVYEAYAAPLATNLDPALIRADLENPGGFSDANDDDGWQLGARLNQFVGTGRLEHFAVTRTKSGRGDVGVLVRRDPVLLLNPATPTPVSKGTSTWRRMTLTAGTWSLRTTDLPPGLDPVLTAYDGSSGAALAMNDDGEDGDPAARVLLKLERPTDIIIRLDSLQGDGDCTVEATRVTRPAVEQHPTVRGDPPELST